MVKPKIFIGSSSEGLEVARAIQVQLESVAEVTVWTDNVFGLSRANYEALEEALLKFDFSVFVLSADDSVASRGNRQRMPRDNVLFELGLFAGRHGLRRTFIVHPKGIKIPSDLHGVVTAQYELHTDGNVAAALGASCTKIRSAISSFRAPTPSVGWDEFCGLIRDLGSALRRSPRLGGFSFDVLVGISRGGVVVADLLSRHFGGNIPVLALWADRHTRHPHSEFAFPLNWVNSTVPIVLNNDHVTNVLLVDDISRSGHTINAARQFLSNVAPGKNIRTAVLIRSVNVRADYIDYAVTSRDTKVLRTPFSALD